MRVQSFEAWMDIDYHLFHEFIINRIPSGRNIRDRHSTTLEQKYMDVYREAKELILQLKCYRELKETKRLNKSIGTLGGGNHFIELDKDENRMIEEYKAAGRRAELQDAIRELHNSFKMKRPGIPDALCYLEGSYREDYLHDMRLCQRWAILNRQLICDIIMDYFRSNGHIKKEHDSFESVHNYIGDDNIIRKGAISAREGQKCIIPLNMRDGSLICTDKGNEDWNCSAPHGAGRIMSRARAFKELSMDDFRKSMKGIYSESLSEQSPITQGLTKDASKMSSGSIRWTTQTTSSTHWLHPENISDAALKTISSIPSPPHAAMTLRITTMHWQTPKPVHT